MHLVAISPLRPLPVMNREIAVCGEFRQQRADMGERESAKVCQPAQ